MKTLYIWNQQLEGKDNAGRVTWLNFQCKPALLTYGLLFYVVEVSYSFGLLLVMQSIIQLLRIIQVNVYRVLKVCGVGECKSMMRGWLEAAEETHHAIRAGAGNNRKRTLDKIKNNVWCCSRQYHCADYMYQCDFHYRLLKFTWENKILQILEQMEGCQPLVICYQNLWQARSYWFMCWYDSPICSSSKSAVCQNNLVDTCNFLYLQGFSLDFDPVQTSLHIGLGTHTYSDINNLLQAVLENDLVVLIVIFDATVSWHFPINYGQRVQGYLVGRSYPTSKNLHDFKPKQRTTRVLKIKHCCCFKNCVIVDLHWNFIN